MNALQTVNKCIVIHDETHDLKANFIVLGPAEHRQFCNEVRAIMAPLKSDPYRQGEGRWYRGCRVLLAEEPGIWVGRVVVPLK